MGDPEPRFCIWTAGHLHEKQLFPGDTCIYAYKQLFAGVRSCKSKTNSSKNIARIANAVQCHNQLSGNKDRHEFRCSQLSI